MSKFNPKLCLLGPRGACSPRALSTPRPHKYFACVDKARLIKAVTLKPDDIVIATMGVTGTGKSMFIDVATRQNGKTVGHQLKSYTSRIRAVEFPHPETRQKVVLVDTPGFDWTTRSDTEILAMIASWLQKTYQGNVKLTGIIYFHRITDNRMAGSPLKNFKMFTHLCGEHAASRVILCTTMWLQLRNQEIGTAQENELNTNHWKPMIDHGSAVCRFNASFESAWAIIDKLITANNLENEQLCPVLLQEELVEHNKRLQDTQAYRARRSIHLERSLEEQKKVIRRMRDDATAKNNQELSREYDLQLGMLEGHSHESHEPTTSGPRTSEGSGLRHLLFWRKS